MTDQGNNIFIPRPDAHAAGKWCHLLSPVQDATRDLLERIRGTVAEVQGDSLDGLPAPRPGQRARDDNIANCFLVYGERGTGKSTVLFNARKAVEVGDSFFRPEKEASKENGPGALDRERIDRIRVATCQCVKGLQDVVWLEELDLEPLPAKSNLLTILLTRVRNALDRPGIEATGMAPTSRFEESVEGARQKLTHLISDASLVWEDIVEKDTRIKANRQVVAADIYANFRENFLSAMQELSKELAVRRGRRERGGVIILPVDNIDRSTEHLYGIVKMAQMVSCRQLLLVMAGSRVDVEAFLERAYWKELIRVGSGAGGGGKVGVDGEDEAFRMARRQATAAAQKLLPQSHRVEVQRVKAAETLDFRLFSSRGGANGEGKQESIRELFGKLKLHSGNIRIDRKYDDRRLTLLQLFEMGALSVPEPNESAKMQEADCANSKGSDGKVESSGEPRPPLTYAAEYGLRLTARGVLDLWQLAHWEAGRPTEGNGKNDLRAEKIARTMLRNVISESTLSNNMGKRIQEKIILRNAEGGTLLDFLEVGPKERVKRLFKWDRPYRFSTPPRNVIDAHSERGEACPIRTTLHTNKMKGVFLYIQNNPPSTNGQELVEIKELPSEVAAWLIVLHDIVRWTKQSSLIGFGDIPTAPWVLVEHEVPRSNPPGIDQIELRWQAPDWGSFLAHDIFRKRWSSFLLRMERKDWCRDSELKKRKREDREEEWSSSKQEQSREMDFRTRLLLCGWVACVLETFFSLSINARGIVIEDTSGLESEVDLADHVVNNKEGIEVVEKRVADVVTGLYRHIRDLGACRTDGGMYLPNRQSAYMRDWLEQALPLLLSPLYSPIAAGAQKETSPLLRKFSKHEKLCGVWLDNAPFIDAGLKEVLVKQLRGSKPLGGDSAEREKRVLEIVNELSAWGPFAVLEQMQQPDKSG